MATKHATKKLRTSLPVRIAPSMLSSDFANLGTSCVVSSESRYRKTHSNSVGGETYDEMRSRLASYGCNGRTFRTESNSWSTNCEEFEKTYECIFGLSSYGQRTEEMGGRFRKGWSQSILLSH